MNINFEFIETLEAKKNSEFEYEGSLKNVRGLCIGDIHKVYVNLGASQWKEIYELYGEDALIRSISQTIAHEFCHGLIDGGLRQLFRRGEEDIVKILVGQKESLGDFKIEIFK